MRLWLRISAEDKRKLGVIADSMGGMSLSAVIRYLIRQWFQKNPSQSDTQVANTITRL